jgi:hypothetical protein
MQVGDEQGAPRGPEQRTLRERGKGMTGERKGNHGCRYAPLSTRDQPLAGTPDKSACAAVQQA